MDDLINLRLPTNYESLCRETAVSNFTMASDKLAGSLIRSLVASKPGGRFLELGTGTGLSLAWLLDGMNNNSKVTSIDNDQSLMDIARSFFGDDPRVELLCTDGKYWIEDYNGPAFDLIFADTWPGKYNSLEKTLDLVAVGGFYLIDDMIPQSNWPKDHYKKAKELKESLEDRIDFHMSILNWSTGVILLTRRQL